MQKTKLMAAAKAKALEEDIAMAKAKAEASGMAFNKEEIPPGKSLYCYPLCSPSPFCSPSLFCSTSPSYFIHSPALHSALHLHSALNFILLTYTCTYTHINIHCR
jgi:hypothetical protein